jgi:predicted nucleic acid-binding protein
MPGSFIDSNVALYSLSKDESKQRSALALLACGGLISTQVLGEVTNVMRRKLGYP